MGWSDDYLEHHGILGQKWGVRRFQNPDGSLKSAGKKRYTTDANGDYKKVKKSFRTKRLEKAANAAQRDADDLRKHGLTEEADAVQKVANKNRAKAEVSANKKGLTDKQKKMIITGAAIAGTALAAYGGYKIHQANQQNKATKQAIDNATKALNDFKTAQSSMNRPNPIKPTYSSSSQNAALKIDKATVSHTPIDRIQVDRATVDRIKVDRTPINIDSFNKAAQANDDLVNSLLKKNAKSLGL